MLCTYTVIMLQPQQTPLSLADGWAWLARITNSCGGGCDSHGPNPSTNKKKPPFFTATALEVFLRIASQHLYSEYGSAFMNLLKSLQRDVLPQLNTDMPRKAGLEQFLDRFIVSDGADFMSLFSRQAES